MCEGVRQGDLLTFAVFQHLRGLVKFNVVSYLTI